MFFDEPATYDLSRCFICGREASTVEHVIPKWLQNRFNLWNLRLGLPNGTSIPYRQVTVPACGKCNNEVYGALEDRVRSNNATESDVWKWANKIHYALGHKDKILFWDRKNPSYRIGDVIRRDDPLERSRHFLHCVSGDFVTDPDPFGSVFKFEFVRPQRFMFAHMIASSSLTVSLGKVGYIVFVEDGQALSRDISTTKVLKDLPMPLRLEDMLFFYAQCIEQLARHSLGFDALISAGFIVRLGRTVVHDVRPTDKARFRTVCEALGLEWIDTDT